MSTAVCGWPSVPFVTVGQEMTLERTADLTFQIFSLTHHFRLQRVQVHDRLEILSKKEGNQRDSHVQPRVSMRR